MYLESQHLEAKVKLPQVQGEPGQPLLGYREKEAGLLRNAKHLQVKWNFWFLWKVSFVK